MSYESLLADTCEVLAVTNTRNAVGEVERSFSSPVVYSCRLHSTNGLTNLEFGKVFAENQFLLYLPKSAEITIDHKVSLDSEDYKVTRVSPFKDGRGRVHHIECELERLE